MAKKRKHDPNAFSGFQKNKKTLKAPMTAAFEKSPVPVNQSSWQDVQLPEYLWVALIFNEYDENEAFCRLGRIAAEWPSHLARDKPTAQPGSHSAIAALPKSQRDKLVGVVANEFDKHNLSPLCNLENLPALDAWLKFFNDDESLEQWLALGDAIQQCSQFQSRVATHICWFISLVGITSGQMTVPDEFDKIRLDYPANFEMAGGLFRCIVGNYRFFATKWPEQFWAEVFQKLRHAPAPPEDQYLGDNAMGIAYQLTTMIGVLSEHFGATRSSSADRVHETVFAIAFAAASLTYEIVELRAQTRFCGLAVLRTVTECAINLSYLAGKNDPAIWRKFRQYGSGQAHLIYTKLESELADAHCVDRDWIKAFLQEERAKHFIDIELGDWAGANIRIRAEQGGTKDLYDSYYDYSSSILHGDWLGAATVGTTWDLNPFHRLQRVPRVYPRNFPSVVPDLFRVLNRVLDSLNNVYPGMEYRLPDIMPVESTDDGT